MRTIRERIGGEDEILRMHSDKAKTDIRVAMPGIVQSFDPNEQTVTVQLAIREKMRDGDGNLTWIDIPLLLDVPICFPRAGGFVLTMPVKAGNECLVIFADSCEDAWWSNGGIQNQIEIRRHDLSDGFAILGPWSQPNVISNYSTSAAELRTEDGAQRISISSSGINLTGNILINGIDFSSHVHSGVETGSGETGAPKDPD